MPPRRPTAPGSTASLRSANQQRVLTVLRSEGDVTHTQAELARLTGLAPATVSNIVRDLVAAGLVEVESGSGRRGSSIRLSLGAGLVAGVDFGHSHVAVAIGDLTGRLLGELREPLDPSHQYDVALAAATKMLGRLSDEHGAVQRVGLGVPAPVALNRVRAAAILPGWEGVDPRQAAEDVFEVPVSVENDANLGALAEHRQGVAHGHDSSVFVKISSGVGAGIIIDNELFHGSGGTAGELGHLTLDEQGPLCRCGSRGCLEAYVSVGNILEMTDGHLPDADLDTVIAAAREGNVAAYRAFEDAGLHLGWGIASVVNLLNPEVVVVGGDMARAGDLLLESTRIGLRRHALDTLAVTPILPSELGERASLVGAVLLAAETVELSTD